MMSILSFFRRPKPSNSYISKNKKRILRLSNSKESMLFTFYPDSDFNTKAKIIISESTKDAIDPTDLEQIAYSISESLKSKKQLIFIIDDLNSLIKFNKFEKVFRFIMNLKDLISSSTSILIILYNKKDLDKYHLTSLRSELKTL